ncbi:MAG TPA: CPBP family intramembrane glutamic endopeptidase [Isosphaeraceae bacterium]|nr:CPBP family intramembrane glutamic endopeptidase [Isosphaeraceae bacterium]
MTRERGPGQPDPGRVVVMAVLVEGGLAPLALLAGWLLGQPPLLGFAWRRRDAALGAAAALPMLGLLLVGLRWPIAPMARIKRFIDEAVRPLLGACTWIDLALISLAAGVGEEMLFRGAVQGALVRRLGLGAGLAGASLLFGLLHPITAAYVVLAGLMGAYLGLIWALNGNLLTVIVAHALYDFLALLILLRAPPEMPAG